MVWGFKFRSSEKKGTDTWIPGVMWYPMWMSKILGMRWLVRSLSLEASRFWWFLCNFWEPKLSSLDAPFWRELPPKFEPHPVLIWCEIGWLDSNIGCFRSSRTISLFTFSNIRLADPRCWLCVGGRQRRGDQQAGHGANFGSGRLMAGRWCK